jgi:hypothetical protein
LLKLRGPGRPNSGRPGDAPRWILTSRSLSVPEVRLAPIMVLARVVPVGPQSAGTVTTINGLATVNANPGIM